MTGSRWRYRHHNIIVAVKREHRNQLASVKRAKARVRDHKFQQLLRDADTGLLPLKIAAPEVFTVSSDRRRNELLGFLTLIRDTVLNKRRRVYITFSQTTQMVSDGTLLFYAEMNRLTLATAPKKMIGCDYPQNKIVEQVLQQVGIFRVLGKREKAKIEHDTVKHWNSATGTRVEGRKIAPVQEFYQGTMASRLTTSSLYDGLIEAMSNCSHHAYPDAQKADNNTRIDDPRWWMFSQEREGLLSIVFCDLGVGIPNSLRNGVKWKQSFITAILTRLGRGDTDGAMILAAFEVGRSQTGQAHRGKGLQNIKQVLENEGREKLRILSRYGFYEYKFSEDNPPISYETVANFKKEILGTLIFWQIPVGSS